MKLETNVHTEMTEETLITARETKQWRITCHQTSRFVSM